MFKIHTRDGRTAKVDLTDADQAREWLQRFKDTGFQQNITGISVVQRCGGRVRCPNCNRAARLVCSNCGHSNNPVTCKTGVQHSLSRPRDFRRVFYHIEYVEPNAEIRLRGGEKIVCFADGVRTTMMSHAGQPAARITLLKTGNQRYNPLTE